jgi:hypothetical protein
MVFPFLVCGCSDYRSRSMSSLTISKSLKLEAGRFCSRIFAQVRSRVPRDPPR